MMASRATNGVPTQPQADTRSEVNNSGGAAAAAAAVVDPYANGTLLYHQTIIPTQGISHTVKGSFTLPGSNDVVLVRHNVLELWTLHIGSGSGRGQASGAGGNSAECIHSCPLFVNVLAAAAVPTGLGGGTSAPSPVHDTRGGAQQQRDGRAASAASLFAAGGGYDYLIVTSESGYATVLRYELDEPPVPTRTSLLSANDGNGANTNNNNINTYVAPSLRGRFVKVDEVCLGRSGARLAVPGARLAVDPNGGAVLVTSLMRNKVVLPLRRTSFGTPSSSSSSLGHAGAASSSPSSSALGWLGAGSSTASGAMANGGEFDSGGDDSDDNNNENERSGGAEGKRSLMKGGQDEGAVSRQLARKKKRMQAPRGIIALGTPIDAHRQTVIFSCCALDGFLETSVFAVLEQETVEAQEQQQQEQQQQEQQSNTGNSTAARRQSEKHKYLVVYAYVPSLQQVQRTHLVRLPATAHRLVPVPAAPYGPGGVLVCTDAELVWYDLSPTAFNTTTNNVNNSGGGGDASGAGVPATGVFKCSAPLPRRMAFTETLYDPSIIAHATTCVRRDFFLLLQDEHGDLFRVFLSSVDVQQAYDALKAARTTQQQQQQVTGSTAPPPHVVNPLSVHYFDTIAPVTDMALFPRGFLLAGAETGPFHGLYKIVRDGYTRESEYIVKRVKRVRELAVPAAHANGGGGGGGDDSATLADTKRPREEAEGGGADAGVKKEESHDVDDRKPKATGTLLALLQQQPLPRQQPSPAVAALQTITRVIAVYQPHNALKHLALVQTYPNTPPVVSFTSSIPSSGSAAEEKSVRAPAPPGANQEPTPLLSPPSAAAAAATASSQPQMQFNLVAGRGSGSVLLNARFGYATRREGRFTLPFASEAVIPVLSASALQNLVRELEAAVAQVQAMMDSANSNASVLGSGQAPQKHSSSSVGTAAAAATKAARQKTLQELLATSSNRESHLWTDTLLITTSQGTTVPYHVGRTMEPDWWTGFTTAERTLTAATLKYGVGYVQVTPRGIYVLQPIGKAERERERQSGVPSESNGAAAVAMVQPATWTHRHGKLILAAAATPTTVLVSFAQGGGIASFSFGLTGTQLEQTDDLPTFPPSPAVSLLQPSVESLTGAAMDAQLNAFLYGSGPSSAGGKVHHRSRRQQQQLGAGGARPREELELAAIATIAQEVYLVDPAKLREPVEKINCKDVGSSSSGGGNEEDDLTTRGDDGSVRYSTSGAIVSVLLTYLGGSGGAGGGGSVAGERKAGAMEGQQHGGRRLFCFIGHMNGVLTRCELDPVTAKVMARDELTCGIAPCKVISGDGQTVCYVQSGAHAWRCEVRDGVAKVVPWRFPNRQNAFAYFQKPLLSAGKSGAASSAEVKKEPEEEEAEGGDRARKEGGGGEDDEAVPSLTFITAASAGGAGAGGVGMREECVVALHANELTLFSAQKSGSGASSLEYSFTTHSLPLAGRRILQHTTRPSYYILLSTEHRGYSIADIKAMREERQQQRLLKVDGAADGSTPTAIPLDAPQRALGRANVYNSTLQLYHEESNRVLPRYFFPEGEAVLCGAVGSFVEDFGKEPVVVVGAAAHYTHGAGCGGGAGWAQGWLCAFRFTTQQQQPQGGQKRGQPAPGEPMLKIEPLHRTVIRSDADPKSGAQLPVDYPSAVHICEDVGLLFVGLGAEHGLRIYVWGQQQFLRKRHLPGVPSRIVAIETAWVAPPPGSATTNSSNNFLSDLYHVPFSNPDALKRAREQRLLVFCATASHSVLVASLQSGAGNGNNNSANSHAQGSIPSFLLIVARDAVPRSLTSSLVVLRDGRTVAVADRFGNVTFLRVGLDNRNGFSLPVGDMRDAQLAEAENFISHKQYLEEVASHATGQVVTSLKKQYYDPSNGTDPALAVELVVYSTSLGAVGAYVPFVSEADAALAAYAQPLLAGHMRTLLAPQSGALPAHQRGTLTSTAGTVPGHHVIEGDVFQLYRSQSRDGAGAAAAPLPPRPPTAGASAFVTSSVFTAEAKAIVEEELKRARHVEMARRRVLGLPSRELPELTDLIAKQRALASLPQ